MARPLVRGALLGSILAAVAAAQTTERLSVDSAGQEANNRSIWPSISAQGRCVAFQSAATNLVPNDTNGHVDVFVRDRLTGQTTRVSVRTNGVQGNADCEHAALSANARFVAFDSSATNLVAGDTNQAIDVFVHDRMTGETTRVSVDSAGAQGSIFFSSQSPAISADGRYVAFESGAQLVATDTNQRVDIYVRDRVAGLTTLASLDSAGLQTNGNSSAPAISFDGRHVAFVSLATNLVPPDTNGFDDVFVRDRETGQTVRASIATSGAPGNGLSHTVSISDDGRWVAFFSYSSNLVPLDSNTVPDIFVRDVVGGVTTCASVNSAGQHANQQSHSPTISADGRYVAFVSAAGNLAGFGTFGQSHVYVRDLQAGLTTIESHIPGWTFALAAQDPVLSGRGRHVVFWSASGGYVPGDTNSDEDVFLRERSGAATPIPFCAGDATGAACPCGNLSGAGRGCENSTGTGGALLASSGTARLGADSLGLHGSWLLPNTTVLCFQGTLPVAGTLGVPFADGLRCVGGTVTRLATKPSQNGAASFGPAAGDPPLSVLGAIPPGGGTFHYQLWYRDPDPGFCTGATANLSNALAVVWTP